MSYFNRMMNHIRTAKQEAYDWLIQRDVSKWSLLFDNGCRYSIMTTNASECFNGVLKRARGLPIQGLVMAIYYNLVSLFMRRSTDVEKWLQVGESEFVPRTMTTLQRAEREARRCLEPVTINRREFEVVDTSCRPHKVEILTTDTCTCTCMKPQLYHVPCIHVLAIAGHRRWNHNNFVSKYFTLKLYKATYSGLFHVVPPKDFWPNFSEQEGIMPLIAPAFRRRVGRPRSNRYRNTMDEVPSISNRSCGHCKNKGHNIATCPFNPSSSRLCYPQARQTYIAMADRSRRGRSGRRTSEATTTTNNLPVQTSITSLGASHRAHDPDQASPLVAATHLRMAREWPIECPRMIYADYDIRSSAIVEPLAEGDGQNASSLQLAIDQVAELSSRVQQSVYIDYTTFDTRTGEQIETGEQRPGSYRAQGPRRSTSEASSRSMGSRQREPAQGDLPRHSMYTPSIHYDATGAGPSTHTWSTYSGQGTAPGDVYYDTQSQQPTTYSLFPMDIPEWMSSVGLPSSPTQ
ncbi:hypothetical protein M5K25_014827 [Dendrobium thyrsiflorum]|uniref:SWIM-type domain-containing protein n=1 Tax=Dendrobium thyrsiflorum TaxID=117978 RepID=A0ABD0UNQ5_DENTH